MQSSDYPHRMARIMKAVYRIVAALAAALAFPALWFLKIIHYVIDLGFTDGYLDDEVSISDIMSFMSDKGSSFKMPELTSNVVKTLEPLKASAITTAVFLAVMLLMIVAVIICSAFTNARKVNLCFSFVGAVGTIGAMAAFNHLTSLVIDGTVPLSSIIDAFFADSGSFLGSLASMFGLGSAVSLIGELVLLRLSSAVVMVLIIFIFLIFWIGAFMLVDMQPDGKIKKQK